MAAYLVTAIHEMAHIASMDGGPEFSHEQMNKAAIALGVRGGFDEYVDRNCVDPKYSAYPPKKR